MKDDDRCQNVTKGRMEWHMITNTEWRSMMEGDEICKNVMKGDKEWQRVTNGDKEWRIMAKCDKGG